MRVLFALRLRVVYLLVAVVLQTLLPAPKALGQTTTAPVDHEQFIAYWTTETGWRSELQLRNNLVSQDLAVTPNLRTTDGVETSLPAVTIKPQEVKVVDIEAAIGAAAPRSWAHTVPWFFAITHQMMRTCTQR